jgi:twinkle protein
MTFEDNDIKVPINARGNIKTFCPKCHDTRKNKRDKSLSVNIEEKIWHCHNCNWSGKLIEKQIKTYFKPLPAKINISEKALQWLYSRGLSSNTIQRFKIGESEEFMPQVNTKRHCLNFNYFRNDELINIKFRDGAKNFKMVAGAELIFYNVDTLMGAEDCCITEGEIDCMSAYEAGYFQTVSVPNGASMGSQKLEYLNNCYEYFAGIKRIVLATDGDKAGIALRDELARRFGRHRCFFVSYPEGCKDLNEVLLKFGKERVKELISEALPFPIEGIFRAEDLEDELDYIYQNGFDTGLKIGYTEFDQLFSIRMGELTTITGIPGHGKSAFVDQILVRLSSRHGLKHGVISFENQPISLHISKLASCFTGRPYYRLNKADRMNETEYTYAKYFINESFFFFAINEVDFTIDAILEKAVELVIRYGINTLTIDPWNYIEQNATQGMTETQYISKCLTKIGNFAKAYNTHVFLIAHPTKIPKDKITKKFDIPDLYSISGSSHFFNKTDNGFTVYLDGPEVGIHVQKIRFFFVGKKGLVLFAYDISTGRYAEVGSPFEYETGHYLKQAGLRYQDFQRIAGENFQVNTEGQLLVQTDKPVFLGRNPLPAEDLFADDNPL